MGINDSMAANLAANLGPRTEYDSFYITQTLRFGVLDSLADFLR